MEEIQGQIRHLLGTLRSTIRARGFTQVQVQERLGWGRSSISQTLTRQKALRIESLLLILQAIDVSPGEFYTEHYLWPPLEEPVSEPPRLDPGAEVDRVLVHLATKIRSQGSTQAAVERHLGWGKGYVSQLMQKQKRLRVDQVLAILAALELEPREFFWELYRPAQFGEARRYGEKGPRMAVMLEGLTGAIAELCGTLVRKGLLTTRDLPTLFQPVESEELPWIDERQLPLPIVGDEE